MKKIIGIFAVMLMPLSAMATNLFPLPSDWIDQVATSTVPLMSGFGPMLWFLVGVGLFGAVVHWLTGR